MHSPASYVRLQKSDAQSNSNLTVQYSFAKRSAIRRDNWSLTSNCFGHAKRRTIETHKPETAETHGAHKENQKNGLQGNEEDRGAIRNYGPLGSRDTCWQQRILRLPTTCCIGV